jgi:CRISPR-associated endonuclease Csn1
VPNGADRPILIDSTFERNNKFRDDKMMRYRLALDLGSTSLGWAMIRLNHEVPPAPIAVTKAGVRIFSDGRNPKDGSSLAVTRREARAMRRRRDRLLKRKARMMQTLIAHGFFPKDTAERKALETLNPYTLRAKGLDAALSPAEFGRALFHINQRRGFKSNRKTDKKDNDSGALKTAINKLRQDLLDTNCRTVGEWLHKRDAVGERVRARYRQTPVIKEDGKTRIDKSYDLYIERAMIEAEFDALWTAQALHNPTLFNATARDELKDALLFQRPLKPVIPGRCTLLPNEVRAPLALPSTQRFRIYQELANLRILGDGLKEQVLTREQRDKLAQALETGHKSFKTAIPKLLNMSGGIKFNLADAKRLELKGNITCAILSKKDLFGDAWWTFDEAKQDAIVLQLIKEENEARLIRWLQDETGVDEARAEKLANVALPEGYGSLSAKALMRILPALRGAVVSYAEAARAVGFHHSRLSDNGAVPGRTFEIEKIDSETGEIKTLNVFNEMPYYGEFLQRHVGFADPKAKLEDIPEKRFGRIANPTVHIGLNQVRLVVNALITRYGHPSQVIVEVARDLKRSKDQRDEDSKRQAENQRRNQRHRAAIAGILNISQERVRGADLQKMVLWEELSFDPAERRCPYSGVQISAAMLLSDEVEIEHILPFSQTLDDSLNNKTVAMRQANRYKGNNTPWKAFGENTVQGFDYAAILQRAELMPRAKRARFAEDGMERWLKDDKGFLARALNDTKYLSKVAREYMSLICPQDTRVIPGQMTAMLRGKFGLNDVLGINGEKNRNDHRHHAVDACVIGVTDQGLLKRFADASASAREKQLNRLVETMPDPWPSYRAHVQRAVGHIWVSHKPDHGHEGAMHNDTAYGLLGNGRVSVHKQVEGKRTYIEDNLKVIEFGNPKSGERHGLLPDGTPQPYKGYKGDSNYCMEIIRSEQGAWAWEVVSTFEAYQAVRQFGVARLRHRTLSLSEKPLVMRLIIGDYLFADFKGQPRLLTVKKIKSNGAIFVAQHNEANVRQREDEKDSSLIYGSFSAGTLRKSRGRCVSISPAGELNDPGFRE